jgi:sterol desaturase/sphingolipid hydroxylase (fatty acid hydroxylase superfamily)
MTGWFSKDNPVPHLRWSIAGSYMCFGAVVLVGIALLCYTSVPKLFSIFCFLSAAVAITSATYRKAPWLEWLAVFMLMIFVASVSYLTHRHVNQGQ